MERRIEFSGYIAKIARKDVGVGITGTAANQIGEVVFIAGNKLAELAISMANNSDKKTVSGLMISSAKSILMRDIPVPAAHTKEGVPKKLPIPSHRAVKLIRNRGFNVSKKAGAELSACLSGLANAFVKSASTFAGVVDRKTIDIVAVKRAAASGSICNALSTMKIELEGHQVGGNKSSAEAKLTYIPKKQMNDLFNNILNSEKQLAEGMTGESRLMVQLYIEERLARIFRDGGKHAGMCGIKTMQPKHIALADHEHKPHCHVEGGGLEAYKKRLEAAKKAPKPKSPAAKAAAKKAPAKRKPAARKPAAKKPAAKKPAARKPAAKKPAARKPAAKKPAARGRHKGAAAAASLK